MTRTVDTLTDAEVAAHIEAKRHRPRKATAADIKSQRMKWAVEEIRAEERERCAQYLEAIAQEYEQFNFRLHRAVAANYRRHAENIRNLEAE